MMLRIVLAALIAVTVTAVCTDGTVCEDMCSDRVCGDYPEAQCVQDCSCDAAWTIDGVDVTEECDEVDLDGLELDLLEELAEVQDELEAEKMEDEMEIEESDDGNINKRKAWKARRKARRQAWLKKKAGQKGGNRKSWKAKKVAKEARREKLINKWTEKGLTEKAEQFQTKWAEQSERKKTKFAMKKQKKQERKEMKKAMTPEEKQEWIADKKANKQTRMQKRQQWKGKKMVRKEARKVARKTARKELQNN